MSAPPALLPGDSVGPISLPAADGAPFDLTHQSIAARYRVLLLGSPPTPERLAALAGAAAAGDALLLLVEAAAPSGAAELAGVRRLFDPEQRLFAALGLGAGGAAVLSPRGRLAFLQGGPAAAEAALAMLPAPAPAAVRSGGAPVLLVPDILDATQRAALLAYWEAGEKFADRVSSGAAGAAATAERIKRRADVVLGEPGLFAGFRQAVERRVAPEMFRAFRFRVASLEPPRIGCYDAADAGAFGAHRDNRTPFTAHRRFAMSLNLNTGDYAGGRLRFPEFGTEEYEPGPGAAAIFCCDLLHEALPVTAGRRFAVFTFFTDAEGARAEQALIAQRLAAGESGVRLG